MVALHTQRCERLVHDQLAASKKQRKRSSYSEYTEPRSTDAMSREGVVDVP